MVRSTLHDAIPLEDAPRVPCHAYICVCVLSHACVCGASCSAIPSSRPPNRWSRYDMILINNRIAPPSGRVAVASCALSRVKHAGTSNSQLIAVQSSPVQSSPVQSGSPVQSSPVYVFVR